MNRYIIATTITLLLIGHSCLYAQWERQSNGLPDSWGSGWAMDACDYNNAIITVSSTEHPLYKTTDGGSNWFPVDINVEYTDTPIDVELVSPDHIVVVVNSKVLVSTNGGTNWIVAYDDPTKTSFMNYVEMFDDNTGIAMGDAVENNPALFLYTNDGGLTWVEENQSFLLGGVSADIWRRLDFINSEKGFVLISHPTESGLYSTTDSGKSWTKTPFDGWFNIIKFYDENIGLGLIDVGDPSIPEVKRTTDGGYTWENCDLDIDGWGLDIEFIPGNPNQVWATDGGGLYFSSDMGTSWTIYSDISGPYGYYTKRDIVFVDDNNGWILCGGGRLYHTTNNAQMTTDIQDDFPTTNFSLYQNYPNPFNPTTNISFQLAESSFTSLKIYNSLGEEIKTLLNKYISAGTHEIKFNAVNLPSGVYFYKLQAGKFSETKKLLLMK